MHMSICTYTYKHKSYTSVSQGFDKVLYINVLYQMAQESAPWLQCYDKIWATWVNKLTQANIVNAVLDVGNNTQKGYHFIHSVHAHVVYLKEIQSSLVISSRPV